MSATSPFGHAPYPLAHTLDYEGDPGLLGPGSVSWLVIGDVATFVGGIRALLLQSAHPEVVAGVGDHSRYREDPLGRLSRTSAYVTATTYGAIPEVEAAVAQVRRIHRIVEGTSSRGRPYDADDPGFSAWVHNVLTDSFLVAHQTFGALRLDEQDQDQFVLEQTRVGELLGADPMPESAARAGGVGRGASRPRAIPGDARCRGVSVRPAVWIRGSNSGTGSSSRRRSPRSPHGFGRSSGLPPSPERSPWAGWRLLHFAGPWGIHRRGSWL